MLKQNKYLLILLSFSFFSFFGCHAGNEDAKSTTAVDTLNYVNLTILLDLSDRISVPGQIDRDTIIIRQIVNEFQNQVARNHFQYSRDKIQVLIAPQADNMTINFNPYIDIEEEANSNKIVRQILPAKVETFMKAVREIYSGHPKFTGADIWSFFKNMPASLLKKSYTAKLSGETVYYNFENKMIILTDGYMVFDEPIQERRAADRTCMQVAKLRNDKNWQADFSKYKMKPISGKDFGNLEVLLLEVNPKNPQINTNEISIIQKYWQTWFSEMHTNLYSLQQNNEAIPLINATVKAFISH